MKEKIHYVYKIINLKNNKEYIGVRSHPNPKKDIYMGSSRILENLYKLEGKENFTKEILKTFNTRKEAEDYESLLLTESFCNSPNTYNIINTGEFNGNKHGFRKDIWFDYYNQIRKEYGKGSTIKELGEYYNCDSGTIRMVIQDIKRTNSESQKIRFDKFLTSGNRDLELDKHIGDIIKLYVEDLKSLIHISKQYGVDPSTIKRRLVVEGVVIRNHKTSQQLRKDNRKRAKAWDFEKEIVSLFLQGVSIPSLSKTYESDYNTIKSILQHNKIK